MKCVIVAILLCFALLVEGMFHFAFAEIGRVKDRTGKTVAYIVTEEDTGTVRIKDRQWNTVGYLK